MIIEVNSDSCIGCGACTTIVPEIFKSDDYGIAYVYTNTYEKIGSIYKAKKTCPVKAIKIIER